MPARRIPATSPVRGPSTTTFDVVSAAPEPAPAKAGDAENAVRFRRGWFLGDGTGAGKGRQVAGIILDNWLKGRRRAVWISKSDKLIEDAQRDWSALGQERLLITPLARFRQGTPIRLDEGILFTTYATLRSAEREAKASRVQQIIDWLGRDFDGVIVFDEVACDGRTPPARSPSAATRRPSQQGRAGLRLQHALPDARVLYVSATGATTVHNLAYAQRLGPLGRRRFPVRDARRVRPGDRGGRRRRDGSAGARPESARPLCRALALLRGRRIRAGRARADPRADPHLRRLCRRLPDHPQQSDRGARSRATSPAPPARLNGQAKSAARSAFESAKQRFFNHLITAMKTPALIAAIERDLEAGHAAIIQIVSTGEALMERRLAEIPTEEWGDVQVDITPREYVLDYLAHSLPDPALRAVHRQRGQSVVAAGLSRRPAGAMPRGRRAARPHDRAAGVAGAGPRRARPDRAALRHAIRSPRSPAARAASCASGDRLCVENRAGSANLAEAQAFMDDEKRILVFSDAGGTGRSYHADLGARNRRLRVHYLLEAGWKADTAIQGLGRSNRTNQAQPPLFRPIATDVKAEKRFLSTIARRLDTLGAITKGQRQTGGQGLFRADDNLEIRLCPRRAAPALCAALHAARSKAARCKPSRTRRASG